jgi:hypothetical protein
LFKQVGGGVGEAVGLGGERRIFGLRCRGHGNWVPFRFFPEGTFLRPAQRAGLRQSPISLPAWNRGRTPQRRQFAKGLKRGEKKSSRKCQC